MSKIIEIALKEVGVTETPKSSNKSKYGKWFGFDGVPWCGMFVSWCYNQAGIVMPKIGFSKPGFAGCQTAVAYFRKEKKITLQPQAGDLVFFDWNKDGRYDHVGLFVKWIDDKFFETIEGNTALGNDSNGGKVMRRTRNKNVALFVRI